MRFEATTDELLEKYKTTVLDRIESIKTRLSKAA
jgi:hypothetical protein